MIYSQIQKVVSSHTARAFQGLFDGRKNYEPHYFDE